MITVAYEQVQGLRDKHQKSDGYAISVSKVVPGLLIFCITFGMMKKT